MILPEQVAVTLSELQPYFAQITDAQLKDYGESANAGCWVSFRLPDPESLEVYRGQDRTGRNARTGKRYKLLVIEVDDDETHINHEARSRMENPEPKPRKLSQISGALCHDATFRVWVAETYGDPCPTADYAANFIREACGVDSRALLDSNEAAADTFRKMLAEFDGWKNASGAQQG